MKQVTSCFIILLHEFKLHVLLLVSVVNKIQCYKPTPFHQISIIRIYFSFNHIHNLNYWRIQIQTMQLHHNSVLISSAVMRHVPGSIQVGGFKYKTRFQYMSMHWNSSVSCSEESLPKCWTPTEKDWRLLKQPVKRKR